MKKTTVISISIILFILCTLQSCRQDEMEIVPEENSLAEKENQQKLYLKTENDTLQTTSNLSFDADGNEIKDPPPKDKDQWKH
ncbi:MULTISPECIES: hypothetical protein [Chryseobacterium]|uniref:Lipoprotein n=2 Tax=Chryseobacterium gleum TaxID=250 RepID=A0A3S4PIH1_CHRGE|nr:MULTISPECIES: hypothetical protein [Chryseobacterium]EFK36068.1 hypothetical protein HMPREF0204_15137 [Chryseobacterium gleum ATCC 35910]QQY31770.1 hypothetical protein I6I60_23475 [Chryseobacterium gleum]VEE11193.1 Uncharacterised protein [Chryseobacterium gleum]VFA44006.1 Uncharacterised protein [Chryseobacterium indologenes]